MKKRIVITAFVCLSGGMACSDGGNNGLQPVETTVRLEGSIGLSSRAVIGSGYADALAVCFARQDETVPRSGTYGAWHVCKAVRNGGDGRQPILFTVPQFYPVDGRTIRMQGYFPMEGETVEADTAAGMVQFTVDGTTDIMATDFLNGNAYTPFNTCIFYHLLTQIQLVCYSRDANKWGSVTQIDVENVHTRQQLTFSVVPPFLTDVSSATDIKIVSVPDMPVFPIPEIEEEEELPDPQGIVLLPVSSGSYRLQIVTTKDGRGNETETTSEVAIGVEGGFLTGKSHVISLLFTEESQIKTTFVGVAAWTEHDEVDIPI
ncbi:hypothetical protein [Parabacteroides faecis]|uniref:hypothetical protein n=1 Tax=Parabacteroides faecis TaxID=1217282 RepID=UPI0035218B8C